MRKMTTREAWRRSRINTRRKLQLGDATRKRGRGEGKPPPELARR
jgi:hypothetical protein